MMYPRFIPVSRDPDSPSPLRLIKHIAKSLVPHPGSKNHWFLDDGMGHTFPMDKDLLDSYPDGTIELRRWYRDDDNHLILIYQYVEQAH